MRSNGLRRGPGDGDWQRCGILRFVQEFVRREGYSPSHREVAEGLGLAVSTVSYHVALLGVRGPCGGAGERRAG